MKMAHITISSAKLEESVEFYRDIAGLVIKEDMRGRGPMNIVFMSDESGGTCVELIGDQDESYSGEGVSIGFEVDDAEEYHDELWKRGMETTPMMKPAPGTAFFFVKDPNGLNVQFISRSR